MIKEIRNRVKNCNNLIHCITNPISINQCANVILAVGARPIMAEHPKEVCEITETADALMLNLGNITDVRMESMLIAAETAQKNGIPIVMDAVGVACSELRRDYLLNNFKSLLPTVLKGNYSEIYAIYDNLYSSSGVDADSTLEKKTVTDAAVMLARKFRMIVLASGKEDIITDGKRVVYIKNGSHRLSCITGTGCMLGALVASYLSVRADIESVILASAVFGISGELSETSRGNGSFFVNLLDWLSVITDSDIEKKLDMEEVKIEEI